MKLVLLYLGNTHTGISHKLHKTMLYQYASVSQSNTTMEMCYIFSQCKSVALGESVSHTRWQEGQCSSLCITMLRMSV